MASCDNFVHLHDEAHGSGVYSSTAQVAAPTEETERPTEPTPSISQVREVVAQLLPERGSVSAATLGTQLQRALPGFRHRALGHRTLSDLLRAQDDLLTIEQTPSDLRVSLVHGHETEALPHESTWVHMDDRGPAVEPELSP